MNFEVTMTHSLPLSYFKKFVKEEKESQEVFLNFYMLIEIYKVKVQELWKKAINLKIEAIANGKPFDIRTCQDHDY